MKIWKRAVLFYLGGGAYMMLEVLYRGWSHGSMFLAGGTCFLLLGHMQEVRPRLPLPLRMAMGALVITSVELLAGLLVNRAYTVWDYRQTPFNFCGQICLPFTLLWIPVSGAAFRLYDAVAQRLGLRES